MQPKTPLQALAELSADFPSRLVVMLYDAAISDLNEAIAAIGRGDIEARFNATARVSEIVAELYIALDMERGGEIAANLGKIYNVILAQLPSINLHNDPAICSRMIDLLCPIRDSWRELDDRIRISVADSEADGTALTMSGADAALATGTAA